MSSDCPCIDASSILSNRENDHHEYDIYLSSVNGNCTILSSSLGFGVPYFCYPLSYGSSYCQAHDYDLPPHCSVPDPPSFCEKKWCYVDHQKCKSSEEAIYRSNYVSEPDLFYSYSACDSGMGNTKKSFLVSKSLKKEIVNATIPVIRRNPPFHYKETLEPDGGYYNNDFPYIGIIPEFLYELKKVSDIKMFNLIHRSVSSINRSPKSTFTAAVYDVNAGISQLGVGHFWITSERLALSSFTTSIYSDKILLWIPQVKPTSVSECVIAVTKPFEGSLWGMILGTIVLVAILQVWFSDRKGSHRTWWEVLKGSTWKKATKKQRVKICLTVMTESLMSASADLFAGARYYNPLQICFPNKLLSFGWGLFILFILACYTANFAAVLTNSESQQIINMNDAITKGKRICILSAAREEVLRLWPSAQFVYTENMSENMRKFDAKKCDIIASGKPDIEMNTAALTWFCEQNIKVSDIEVANIPIGFPGRQDIVDALSFIISSARIEGVKYEDFLKTDTLNICDISLGSSTRNSLERFTIAHMALPLSFLVGCAILATIAKCSRNHFSKSGKTGAYNRYFSSSESLVMKSSDTDSLSSDPIISQFGENEEYEEVISTLETALEQLSYAINSKTDDNHRKFVHPINVTKTECTQHQKDVSIVVNNSGLDLEVLDVLKDDKEEKPIKSLKGNAKVGFCHR